MSTFLHIDLNILSLLILVFVFVSGYTRLGWKSLRDKLFMYIVMSTAVCLVSDTLTWVFDGADTALGYAMAVASNVLLYVFGPLPAILWFLYVCAVVTGSSRIPRWLLWGFLMFAASNAAASVVSPFTHTVFFFTAEHLYQRGPAYAAGPGLAFACVLGGLAFVWKRRHDIEPTSFRTLMLFPMVPLLGGALQLAFYGLTTSWSLTTLVILLTYVNMQDSRLDFDYLTGAYNRRYLDRHLHNRIEAALNKPSAPRFAVAFADLDGFKRINDTYGHSEGDAALTAASAIFAENIRGGDMVARYAGDEFVLILELDSDVAARPALGRIERAFTAYRERSGKPYDLSVSIGYCLFSPAMAATAEQMIRLADASMLVRKHATRSLLHGDSPAALG